MTAITVANIDWEIIDDLDDALTAATISSIKVFKQVKKLAKRPQLDENMLMGDTPIACVIYRETTEDEAPEGCLNCAVDVEILLATRGKPKLDDALRLKESLRLINAAKNAVEASPPANATYAGDHNYWHDKLEWGEPEVDDNAEDPWIIVSIPLSVSYILSSSTSH